MKTKIILTLLCCPLLLAGCSSAKETLGLNKKAPDEFKVLKRAPLALPPDYALRPPRPGAPRPQEQDTVTAAAQTVFGDTAAAQQDTPGTTGEMLLQQAGASKADPSIRSKIDGEVEELNEVNESTAEKILGISGFGDDTPPASVVDAKKEAERLKKNAEDNKPLNEGEVPTIEE